LRPFLTSHFWIDRDPNITQNELDQWFYNSAGNGTSGAVDQQDYVDAYRTSNNITSAVSFKLIDFPAENLSLVAVRGTTNAWDALTDAQLWSPAGLFQALRLLLPIGEIWTPILDSMVKIVSWLESATIDRVAFYKETTNFVNYLKNEGVNPHVQITGHSLGGGLAIITGAQTGIAAVALSGPNAKISRDTFSPPLTLEALDTWVFNIIPDRDIVPRFDDVARLFQKIRCIAPINDFAGCHDGRRSLCEILHTCGTGIRPALCDCTTEFGYPEPTPKAGVTKTFKEECAALIESSGYIAG
jgi:lipase ATG15